ncbi:hypothetical protein [Novosphingobium sp.]|uniref:hypothetical protein n=1 Tax=Novosphingobium sp. TaxID=1874826 RepID=UPI001D7CEBB6|nr:hypothetical protein [Novosphingobium sp.]MBX9663734.1 hypothetical protein [Novosphingobium sp.]
MARALIFSGLLLAVCIFAMVRGGKPERYAAWMYVAAFVASALSAQFGAELYHSINWGIFVIDLILAVSLGALALHANRYWTIWASSIQIVAILAHLAKMLVPEIAATAYQITLLVWSYAVIPLLVAATYRHRQRLHLYGADSAWSAQEASAET